MYSLMFISPSAHVMSIFTQCYTWTWPAYSEDGKSNRTLCITLYYGINPLLDHSDMACDSNGITQFYLPLTHEPYLQLPLLPSRRASLPFGWYSLCLPTEGWPGWVDLGGWLYTEIHFPATGVESSINCSRCRVSLFSRPKHYHTKPHCQPADQKRSF